MLDSLNILLVDDDPSAVASVGLMLHRLGATNVTACSSGNEAFAQVVNASRRFDCIIADVSMPDGTGLELLHRIRSVRISRNFRPDMCVVLMSGVASKAIASTARDLDVNAFLVKPFNMHGLHNALIAARKRTFPLNHERYWQVSQPALGVA